MIGVNAFLQQIQRFGLVRLGVMALVTLGLMGFFTLTIMRASQPPMDLLFSDLTSDDAAAMARELETRAIKYELQNDGKSIFVPKDKIAKLRLDFAARGMPSGGIVGYEIFDKSDSFSTTSFVQNINQLRALEGELARSIGTINAVKAARVHLSLPERKLFERDRQPPQASVVLKLKGEIAPNQIQAIRHLIASAVEGLNPQSVSIIDDKGRLLASNSKDDEANQLLLDERQTALEKKLKTQVESIVEQFVGPGRVRALVSAELDSNRIQQTSETFDPESKVTRSTQNRNEASTTSEIKDGSVSVANELPSGQNSNGTQRDAQNKSEEIVNYEISKTTRTELTDAGRLKKISIAVVIDGVYQKDANGTVSYQPRTQEELNKINQLIKSGIGFDAKRGDQIEVSNLRFTEMDEAELKAEQKSWYDLSNYDINRIIELTALTFLSLIVALFVGRPLVKALGRREPTPISDDGIQTPTALAANPIENVTALISARPEASLATIRQWIREPTGP